MLFPIHCRDHRASGAHLKRLGLTEQSVPLSFAVFDGAFGQEIDVAFAGRNCVYMPSHVSMEMMTTSQIVERAGTARQRRSGPQDRLHAGQGVA